MAREPTAGVVFISLRFARFLRAPHHLWWAAYALMQCAGAA
jgi:hypothetical protein